MLPLCLLAICCTLLQPATCLFHGRLGRTPTLEQAFYNHDPAPLAKREDLPKAFSWCHDRQLCVSNWNQHIPVYCGSCWAHGTLSMVQDRLKIAKKGMGPDVMLSRQTLLNCGAFEDFGGGCGGGNVFDAFGYMKEHGLPDESCMTYSATDHSNVTADWKQLKRCPLDAVCRNCMPLNDTDPGTCWAVKEPVLYKLASYGKVEPPGEHGMMSEIYQRGPITCSIATPDSFVYGYRSGIWHDNTSKKKDIDHDVEVVGWGEEDGEKFWTVRNSWGTFWGELGFFRLARGENTFWIEEGDCWYAKPTFEMEEDVREGKLSGSMYGLIDKKRSLDITKLSTA